MQIFNPGDVLQFAIRIEEDGEIFYHRTALNTEDKEARDLFNHLADEEVRHKRVFQEMLAGVEVNPPAEGYSGEYAAYLRDYIDGKVVFTKKTGAEAADATKDALSAILFAMDREADSILYYHEVKQFVNEKNYGEIDKIIEEERRHFAKLSEAAKKYQK